MDNSTDNSIGGSEFWDICYFYKEEVYILIGFPSKVYYINLIVVLAFNIFLTVSTICLNSVTILAYARSALLKSKKAYFLIMLLSVNDLLVGIVANGGFIFVLATVIIDYPKCEIYIVLESTAFCLAAMSVMTLFGLNIERYLSILHPFYHHTKVTKSKLFKVIVAFWFLVVALRLFYVVFGIIMNIIFSVFLFSIVFSTLYIYVSICIATRRQMRVPEMQATEIRGAEVRGATGRKNQACEMQNIKMTKSCALVVSVTFLCNVPYAVSNSLPGSDVIKFWALWSITTQFCSSSLNSLVFFWNNPVLRKEAKRLFKKPQLVK